MGCGVVSRHEVMPALVPDPVLACTLRHSAAPNQSPIESARVLRTMSPRLQLGCAFLRQNDEVAVSIVEEEKSRNDDADRPRNPSHAPTILSSPRTPDSGWRQDAPLVNGASGASAGLSSATSSWVVAASLRRGARFYPQNGDLIGDQPSGARHG